MTWLRRRPCDHQPPRRLVVQVVVTDPAGNVRAVAEAGTWIVCEHYGRAGG